MKTLEIAKLEPLLGAELASMYYYVSQDIFLLRDQWRTYKSLFGTNEQRVELLDGISRNVTRTIEKTLFEAVLMGLRRITDKANSKRNERSVTVKAFARHFEGDDLKHMKRLINEAERAADFAQHWANKKIAHSDYEYRKGNLRLKPALRAKVDDAIEKIASVVKWIANAKLDVALNTYPISEADNEVWFLQHLFEGRRVFEEKENLSRSYSNSGRYQERNELYVFPDWLDQEDDIFDHD